MILIAGSQVCYKDLAWQHTWEVLCALRMVVSLTERGEKGIPLPGQDVV